LNDPDHYYLNMGQFVEFLINHWVLSGLLITAMLALLMSEAKARLWGIKELSPNEATRLINHQNATVIDVREADQFNEGHIINAVHVPYSRIDNELERLKPYANIPKIVYCENGQASAKACHALKQAGFQQLYKLSGGIMSWKNAHLPLVK